MYITQKVNSRISQSIRTDPERKKKNALDVADDAVRPLERDEVRDDGSGGADEEEERERCSR